MREQSKLNQSSKSTSSKRIRRERDISLGSPHREFPAATSTFSGLVAIFIMLMVGLIINNNTYASSISISLTGNVSLNLIKSNTEAVFGKSTTQTATVTSDHFTGYTLMIAGSNDTGRLVGTNDNTKYLSSIPNAMSESSFNTDTYNDMWGFLPNKLNSVTNTNYQKSPIATTPTTIDVTNSPNTSGTDYTLALAARVSQNMSLDSYGQTFVLAATGNGYDYHIGYTDVMETLPADQYGNTQSSTVTLSTTTPTKAGYTFGGWCTVSPTVTVNGTTCPSGVATYQPGNTVTLDGATSNDLELFAIWSAVTFDKAFSDAGKTKVGSYYAMQDMTSSICNAVAIGQEGTLVDNRADKKTYTVGKLKDGRCWMLDNLALGGSNAIALKTTDTNIAADWTLPATRTDGFDSWTEARVNTTYNNTVPTDAMSQAGQWKVGAYYNYCAASAGAYCPAENTAGNDPVTHDICPKGWRMPSGGLGGEYKTAWDAYNNDYSNFRTAMRLSLSGDFTNNQVNNQGVFGCWWSTVFYNGYAMYRLQASTSDINIVGGSYRRDGMSMRCLAK